MGHSSVVMTRRYLAIVFLLMYFKSTYSSGCSKALGMESKKIPNAALTSSSDFNYWQGSTQARLNLKPFSSWIPTGWTPAISNANQWLQIYLGAFHKVTGIASQGRGSTRATQNWVKSYKLSYSKDGKTWIFYKDGRGFVKVFAGNTDSTTVVKNIIKPSFSAFYVRIHPVSWIGAISLRVELYGCVDFQGCGKQLGMQNKAIPDNNINSSSQLSSKYAASQGRLNNIPSAVSGGCWRSGNRGFVTWFSVNLGRVSKIVAIGTQGNPVLDEWVTYFKLRYGYDGNHWASIYDSYGTTKYFIGNADRNTEKQNLFSPPIIAQYVRIEPVLWRGNRAALRVEFYGCTQVPKCFFPLGFEDKRLDNSAFTASSSISFANGPTSGRLHTSRSQFSVGGWAPLDTDINPWLQVDLKVITTVAGVGTQGGANYWWVQGCWVTTYELGSSKDGTTWKKYAVNGTIKVFDGNTESNSVIVHKLSTPIKVTKIRIFPKTWYGSPYLRAELYGCTENQKRGYTCLGNPCKNNSTCTEQANNYTCKCAIGFTGRNCDININECARGPCLNGGKCSDLLNDFRCSCQNGFTGRICDKAPNYCSSGPCRNGAKCTNAVNNYTCTCTAGFTGRHCEVDIDDCKKVPCKNNATCADHVNNYTCTCAVGFTGRNCEIDIDDCKNAPCKNNATCTDLVNNYTCSCALGFAGRNCEIDIDDCKKSPCQNNATCVDHVNNYTCACAVGFTGRNCEIDIDDCKKAPCKNNATCADHVNNYTCTCAMGFTGRNCETDIDDCKKAPCKNNATCADHVNNYTCTCAMGFTGRNCETDIDDCKKTPCRNNATCADHVNNYTCTCAMGFTGRNCETDIDDCKKTPCRNNATCTDLVNNYICTCAMGFTGRNCEIDIDDCKKVPCKHNATCTDLVNNYICSCPIGFNGRNCETNIDDCRKVPCKNNASCKDLVNNYICTCLTGFTGKNCETDIDDCRNNPCKNNATCVDHVDNYTCSCVNGSTGRNCEIGTNECRSSPCKNNGTCVNHVNKYTCNCPKTFTGKNCETVLTHCSSKPCMNGGTCINKLKTYWCRCKDGYDGNQCEIVLNPKKECGRRVQSRIVGGKNAFPGSWPWQMTLHARGQTAHYCGATLISKEWAITAAHCVLFRKPHEIFAVLGEFDVSQHEGNEVVKNFSQIISHPIYKWWTSDYDVALLKFAKPLKRFNRFIYPICLPLNTELPPVGTQFTITGFGRLKHGGATPSRLQQAVVPLVSHDTCVNAYKGKAVITPRMMCAGFTKGGIDACQGDSGGPFVRERANYCWYLYGVISWGIGCANPNSYGVYTNLLKVRPWIKKNTNV